MSLALTRGSPTIAAGRWWQVAMDKKSSPFVSGIIKGRKT